ncbi:hypothetical protein EV700_1941 [Fluviicoccus keumensis]|uniref:Uncharacterized protein n=1 Tax=Fluviicoccus keumensis TaxID=1435465 RepID=A0A4Q7Z640_9GAMM|nr:hypothetical protein EV700_1941 [Fluviicoccus keumensis]
MINFTLIRMRKCQNHFSCIAEYSYFLGRLMLRRIFWIKCTCI